MCDRENGCRETVFVGGRVGFAEVGWKSGRDGFVEGGW